MSSLNMAEYIRKKKTLNMIHLEEFQHALKQIISDMSRNVETSKL